MANTLDQDLTGKVVIFRQAALSVPALDHPFRVEGGFGAVGFTMGRALIGTFISDGEVARMDGFDVERLATPEEISRFEKVGA